MPVVIRSLAQVLVLLVAVSLTAAACSADNATGLDDAVSTASTGDDTPGDDFSDGDPDEAAGFDEDAEAVGSAEHDEFDAADEFDEGPADPATAPEPTSEPAPIVPDTFPGGGVEANKTRDDIDCSADGLGNDENYDFTVARYIVDGDLGAVCFGEADARLVDAWETLATITPAGQLLDLALFGGYASTEGGEETTLAFVNALDDAGSIFQMSVNLDAGDDDPNELTLTMAHEFSHVFTALSTQLDRDAEPDDCATFYSGEGCYLPGSLMAEWIELFWGNGLIDEIDPFAEATGEAGEERCANNAGFFGAYAASNPEEDFAESFSAFVFQLEPDSDEQQDKLDWFSRQPGLVEFQQLAIAANMGPLANNFDYCGI